eukprot:87615-Rhodomonas_salina.2
MVLWSYAVFGTDLAYGGTDSGREPNDAVSTGPSSQVRDVRYWHSVWCYAVSGTGIAQGAMRCPVLT